MSDKPASKSNVIQIRLKGKLQSVDRFDGKHGPIFENLITLPSLDEYNSPTRFVVKAGHQIAQVDSMVEVLVDIRSRYWRNDKTGKPNYVPEFWLAA